MKRLFVLVAFMFTGCYAQAGGGYGYRSGYYVAPAPIIVAPRYYAPSMRCPTPYAEPCGAQICCYNERGILVSTVVP